MVGSHSLGGGSQIQGSVNQIQRDWAEFNGWVMPSLVSCLPALSNGLGFWKANLLRSYRRFMPFAFMIAALQKNPRYIMSDDTTHLI